MNNGWDLEAVLDERRAAHLFRERRTLETAQQPEVIVDGKPVLAFCSNDYLGLAADPDLRKALQEGADRFGVGGGASHLVLGHSYAHQALEDALAEFTGREAALLFSTGFMANIGTITALLGKEDAVFQDRLNHASLLDGGLSSGARFRRYTHNDPSALARQLSKASDARRKLVVTDGVFSMDGDIANLPELARTSKAQGAWLMVDDAHGFGVLGEQGGGSVELSKLNTDDVPVLIGTLGKAFGTAGAFVAGSKALIDTLVQFARSYIYTTSMPPAVAWATLTSLQKVQSEPWRRDQLATLISHFRERGLAMGLELMDSPTPIQPIVVGDSGKALALSQQLQAQGIFVGAIRPPTVAEGSARLRVTLTATHTLAQVDQLLDALARCQDNSL